MVVRPYAFLLVAAAVLLPRPAHAQYFVGRQAPPVLPHLVSRSVQAMAGLQFESQVVTPPFVSPMVAPPTIESQARERFIQVRAEPDSCQTHRQPIRYAQQRVTNASQQASSRLPKPITLPEQLATAKIQGAHLLWKAGKPEAARRWLETVVADFPRTEAALKAKDVLARM
jgi:hypothetical protein